MGTLRLGRITVATMVAIAWGCSGGSGGQGDPAPPPDVPADVAADGAPDRDTDAAPDLGPDPADGAAPDPEPEAGADLAPDPGADPAADASSDPAPDQAADPGMDPAPAETADAEPDAQLPPPGCCTEQAHCTGNTRCEPSIEACLPIPEEGGCWSDLDCADGKTCVGEHLCACGSNPDHSCLDCDVDGGECAPDRTGTCHDMAAMGCCKEDEDCPNGQTCAKGHSGAAPGFGVCLPILTEAGRCWDDQDCGPGQECHGAGYCGCMVDCDLAWEGPGLCAPVGAQCVVVDPALIDEVCDAASLVVFDGTKCVATCPGCCGCKGFCDLTFDSMEACESACNGCAAHGECADGQLCLGFEEGPARECGLCGKAEACHCAAPPWPDDRRCETDLDCQDLACGAGCDDCPPCPRCHNGWCAFETFEVVECVCTGCG